MATGVVGFCKHVLLAYFGDIYIFRANFICFKQFKLKVTACNGISFSCDFDMKCDADLDVSILLIDNSLLVPCGVYALFRRDICIFPKQCVIFILRLSIFDVYRLFAYFTKVCAQKSPYFSLFRSIASCDHQLLGRSAQASFQPLLAILMFS